jgi:hypothetical protein
MEKENPAFAYELIKARVLQDLRTFSIPKQRLAYTNPGSFINRRTMSVRDPPLFNKYVILIGPNCALLSLSLIST